MTAELIDLSERRASRTSMDVAHVDEPRRPDWDYILEVFDAAQALLDVMEIDLDHITQEDDGTVTVEDMIACAVAGLSKFLRDLPYRHYPAKGWDRGRRRTRIDT
jgi:hypothetical protein